MHKALTRTAFTLVLAGGLYGIGLFAGITLSDFAFSRLLPRARAPESVARFEPSSRAVIEKMLRMADVTKDDIVYDLGCGDGRIVIAAASTAGARGVGVDIDPDLVAKSRENAVLAGVGHLVQFRREDLFRTDIGRASVVMLYLSPDGNRKLRPRLLAELTPGTRIVSNSHDMGDWKPDAESAVDGCRVYAWTVPARVAGVWQLDVRGRKADSFPVTFRQKFQEIDGEIKTEKKDVVFSRARLEGNKVIFRVRQRVGSAASGAEFTGRVAGSRMTGKFRTKKTSGTWAAERIASIPSPR